MIESLNYSIWKKDNRSILEDFSHKRILVAYSGGKDSSVILHFLQKAAEDFGFRFEAHAALFPHHVLTEMEVSKLDGYWNKRGVDIKWHDVSVPDEQLEQALRGGVNPCLICKQSKKKKILNNFIQSNSQWENLVVIMSYSLWDLVSATVEQLLGAVYCNSEHTDLSQKDNSEERFLETFQRFYPLLKLKNGLTIFKPLIRYNDQEINEVVSGNEIPLADNPCRYKAYRPKRFFEKYYDANNMRFEFEKVLDFVKKTFNFPEISQFEDLELEAYVIKML